MPTCCCVPKCTQTGYLDDNGWPVSFFNFPKDLILRKKWIHAIRRDEGKDFTIVKSIKVCSLHFRPSDLRKSLNGRIFVKSNAVPSKFEWQKQSPKKKKVPTQRCSPRLRAARKTNKAASTSTECRVIWPQDISADLPSEISVDQSPKETSINGLNEELGQLIDEVKHREDKVKLRGDMEHLSNENLRSKEEVLSLKIQLQELKEDLESSNKESSR